LLSCLKTPHKLYSLVAFCVKKPHILLFPEFVYCSKMDATAKEIKTVFELYDADGSGYVTKEELASALRQLSSVKPTQEEIDRTMQEADVDNDGLIGLVEFAGQRFMKFSCLNSECPPHLH